MGDLPQPEGSLVMKYSSESPESSLGATRSATHRLGLMRLFAAAGALAIGVFSIAMAMLLGWFLEGRMLERDAFVSRDFVQSIATTQQIAPVLRRSVAQASAVEPSFNEFIAHLAAMPSVLRVNVYGADRRVLWSSRPEMIGRVFGTNEELDEALAGGVVVHAAAAPGAPDKAENMLLGAQPSEYVENYVPVRDESGRTVIAVVELYRRPDALFESIRSGQPRACAMGVRMSGLPSWARIEPSTYSTIECTMLCGCTTTSTRAGSMPNSRQASMSSRPLFIRVAESTEILRPMLQRGWAQAWSGVTPAMASAGVRRKGPPDAVSSTRCTP